MTLFPENGCPRLLRRRILCACTYNDSHTAVSAFFAMPRRFPLAIRLELFCNPFGACGKPVPPAKIAGHVRMPHYGIGSMSKEYQNMGFFDTLIVRPFGLLLMWIYSLVNNYGLAIILFATIAKLILLPFSYKSKKSMAKMTKMQDKLNKLQKQYANNRVKLNEEITKLYEKEGVSPMSGCLPSFLPLPIMFGLYYAVQKPLTYMMGFLENGPDIPLLAQAVGITDLASQNAYTVQITIAERLGEFFDAAGNLMPEIANLSDNIKNYLVYIDFDFFGLNLAQQPSLSNPSVLWVIPILSGVTAFLSSYLTQKMQGTQLQGSMKTMLYVMPLMSVYFGFILPASVGIYWITNNVLMVVQEFLLGNFLKYQEKKNPSSEPPEEDKKKKKKHKEA